VRLKAKVGLLQGSEVPGLMVRSQLALSLAGTAGLMTEPPKLTSVPTK
jgi:hypothetical protein